MLTLLKTMSIGLLFSGQGAQALGMGRSLYEQSTAAKACFDQANEVLDFDLKQLCFEGPNEALTETKACQPALYVHGNAIVGALREAGKLPEISVACGLSLGELTALSVAEVFDFATGLKIVAERGRLMQEACDATTGGMASLLGGTIEQVEALCAEFEIDMGNLNCPGQTVISGEQSKIDQAVAKAQELDFKRVIPLNVAGAYHSRLMQGAADQFKNFLAEIPFAAPKVAVFTNVTGQRISDPEAIKQALVDQVVSTVRWTDCMAGAAALGVDSFYECGPGKVLAGLAKRIDRSLTITSLSEYEDLPL